MALALGCAGAVIVVIGGASKRSRRDELSHAIGASSSAEQRIQRGRAGGMRLEGLAGRPLCGNAFVALWTLARCVIAVIVHGLVAGSMENYTPGDKCEAFRLDLEPEL